MINFYFVRRVVEVGRYIKYIGRVMLYKVAKEKANKRLPQCWKYGISAPWE